MTRGVLLFVFSGGFDYYTLAIKNAARIEKHLKLPITIITDNAAKFEHCMFDKIIEISYEETQVKKFFDGLQSFSLEKWKNGNRHLCYNLSPYDETLVIDVDYIINSSFLLNLFETDKDFLIFKNSYDIAGYERTNEFRYINEFSIPFYWATVFFFRKTKYTELFFNLVKFIRENYDFYRLTYQIQSNNFRNDFAFSIAIHILSGFIIDNFDYVVPYPMYFSLDKDFLVKDKDNALTFMITKEKDQNSYSLIKFNNLDIHVMNKQSLLRVLK